MKLAEILTGPEVWRKGSYGKLNPRPGERTCIIGALIRLAHAEVTAGRVWDTARERRRLEQAMGLPVNLSDGFWHDAEGWNDKAGRTWDDVALAIDAYDRDRLLNP